MYLEIAVLLSLVCLNGVLAMSELAVVSSRTARLRNRAERGDRGAQVALDLAAEPGRFLSTVQIGITLVGVLSGAFSGATLGVRLGAALPGWGIPQAYSDEIGIGIVVVAITYLSLIVGELVPKQIALSDPEGVATRVAPAMRLVSVAALPLVWLLDTSGKLMLAVLGQSGKRDTGVSDEEIRLVIAEAEGAGVIQKAETEMLAAVMRIADRSARGLMTPRNDLEIARADEDRNTLLARFASSGRSRLPLSDGEPDHIIGVIHTRDFLTREDDGFDVRSLVHSVPVVHDALPALQVIERLKSSPVHMVLVFDEYGHFEGIITPMDILGAITGGFDETEADEPKMIVREDGSFLVAGWMPVDEFAERIGLGLEAVRDYETVAGLVLYLASDLPQLGQSVQTGGWTIEVVDLDGRRIDKLLVRRS